MIRFSLFGIPIEVQPFFWVSLVILGGNTNVDSADGIMRILLFMLAGFISILVHELGHALTARHFGANVAITLQAFGGFASYSGVRMSRGKSFMITAAGPLIQIVLGYLVVRLVDMELAFSMNGKFFLLTLMRISLFWAILNLLPVFPLDGGQLVNALLGPARIKTTLWISIIVAIVAGLAMFQRTGSFIFPLFLGMFAWQAFQSLQQNRWR